MEDGRGKEGKGGGGEDIFSHLEIIS